jgi:hypothetical protein
MKNFILAVRAWWNQIVLEIRAARAPRKPAELPTYAVKTPGMDETIELPPLRTFDHQPTPEEHRTEARRMALAYARKRTGRPDLTWKQAKFLLERWEKEEREADRTAAKRVAEMTAPKGTIDVRRFKDRAKVTG